MTHRQKMCKENVNFAKVVTRLIEQNDAINLRGELKMDLVQGAGMACTGLAQKGPQQPF